MTVEEFKLPDVGEGVAEGELVSWLVAPGDRVEEDQPVAEVETDKALVEVPSSYDGVVEELFAEEGEMVPVGDVIISFRVDEDGDAEATAGDDAGTEAEPEPESADEPASEPVTEEPDAEPDEPRPGDGAGDALEEPADDGEESADEPESADESAEESAPASALDASAVSVGDALAAEIRDGGLDDETRETLSNAFGPGLSPDQQAQLNRIQSRVEELSEAVAPIDALLDEDEPAVALADLRSDIDDLRADIEALSGEDGAV